MHRIFTYLEKLDCFVIDPAYKQIADYLGLTEWHEAVWIGRYFALDNDYGEHWFDNWDLREMRREQAAALGLDETELLIIDPERFENGKDGPCHSAEERALFWRDVLISLQLSNETLFCEARRHNNEREESDEDFLPDLETRIVAVGSGLLPWHH